MFKYWILGMKNMPRCDHALKKLAILPFILPLSTNIYADDFLLDINLMDKMKKSYSVTPYTSDLLGDRVDIASGSLKFEQVDLSIPGNFAIPVEFRREYNVSVGQNSKEYNGEKELADWVLQLPQIKFPLISKIDAGREFFLPDGFAQNKQCSGDIVPRTMQIYPTTRGSTTRKYIPAEMYSSGPSLIVPGILNERLLATKLTGGPTGLSRDEGMRFYTDSKWRVSCISQANGFGEGYLAQSPNGTKYHLNVITVDRERSVDHGGLFDHATFNFKVSKIEDRFGNWVQYHYSNSGGQLDKIDSSDGRQIDIFYEQGVIKSVKQGSKAVTYEYKNKKLDKVILPDEKKFWKYELSKIMNDDITQSYFNKPWECSTAKLYPSAGSLPAMKITHPYGIVGTFSVDWRIHGKTEVNAAPHPQSFVLGDQPTRGDAVANRRCSYLVSITEKSLSNGDTWKYSYSQNHGRYSDLNYTFLDSLEHRPRAKQFSLIQDSMLINESDLPENVSDNSSDYKYTKVLNKDGSYVKYFFNRNTDRMEFEKMVAVQYIDTLRRIAKEDLYYYERSPAIGRGPLVDYIDIDNEGLPVNKKTEKIYSYDTVDYKEKDTYIHDVVERDVYHYPVIVRSKSDQSEKYTKYEYGNDSTLWLLGSVRAQYSAWTQNTFSDVADYEYVYHSGNNYASLQLPYEFKEFGQWKKRYTEYHNDGNVKKINFPVYAYNSDESKSNIFRGIELDSYYRGIPQIQKYTHRYISSELIQQSASVNDAGLITQFTDFNGNVTRLGYDMLDRLVYVNKPDDVLDEYYTWEDEERRTSIGLPPVRKNSICKLNSSNSGCMSGSIEREKTESFDLMLRLSTFSDKDIPNNYTRVKSYSYNQNGQKTFESYWNLPSTLGGTHYTYDSLGRLRRSYLSADANVIYKYDYLVGNKIKSTDPQGHSTTTTYVAFDKPEYTQATRIESPEQVTTDIGVNLYGNITYVTQSGKGPNGGSLSQTEYRAYNSLQQLCKVTRQDVGVTIFEPNAVGEVITVAQGISSEDPASCVGTVTAEKQVVNLYDNMGDLWKVGYQDTKTPDLTYQRDRNGNILYLASGQNVSHSYSAYNSLNQPDSEILSVDNKIFSIGYEYNKLGALNSITYPNGDKVSYAPNAFGLASKASRIRSGSPDLDYASNVNYHVDGQLDSFIYGNGYNHKAELNKRKALSRIRDFKLNDVLNFAYEYDSNMNVTRLTDGVDDSYSLTLLEYDGLDRLIKVEGNAGIGNSSLSYDGFGNILSYSSKSRNLAYTYDEQANRLTSVSGVQGKYSSFSYDDRGNIENNGKNTFRFNRANQMTQSGTSNTYLYDGHNRRVKQTDSKGLSYSLYSYNGLLLYRETSKGGVNYIYLGKKLIAKDGVITESGDRKHYRPFGESLEAATDDIGYTGHKFDADINLSYMQQRYYDPVIGRFYSNDPVNMLGHMGRGNPTMGFNRYAYANNNPYKYTDPDGRYMIPVSIGSPGNISSRPIAPGGYAGGVGTAKEVAGTTSKLANNIALGSMPFLPESGVIVTVAGTIGTVAGFVEAALGDNPKQDVAIEAISATVPVKITKPLGDIVKGASQAKEFSKEAIGVDMVGSVVENSAGEAIKNSNEEMKKKINN